MHLSGLQMVAWRLLCFVLFRTFRCIFVAVQKIYWALNGTLGEVKRSKHADSYDHCVQVMSVVTVYRTDPLQTIELTDFLLTHERFESPDYIFNNDHVTLMTINDDVAVFGEAMPGQELWRSEFNAFIRLAQVEYCKRLLLVPMSSFHKMSDKLGDPKKPLVFLFNTARCGSTLLTQMLEFTGQCVALSEPDLTNTLSQWYRERGATNEMKQITLNCLRWICRPYKAIQPSVYMLKVCNPGIVAMRFYQELIPTSRCLFMYRGIEKTAQSLYRTAQELPLIKIATILGKYHGYFVEMCIDALGLYGKFYRNKLEDDIDFGMVVWIATCKEYINIRRTGFAIEAIRYEDIIEDKRNATIAVLEFCGLPLSLLDSALKGLEVDSQRKSPVSKAILGRHSDCVMTERARVKFNKMLKESDLPPIEGEGILESTITHKK